MRTGTADKPGALLLGPVDLQHEGRAFHAIGSPADRMDCRHHPPLASKDVVRQGDELRVRCRGGGSEAERCAISASSRSGASEQAVI